MNAPKPYDVAAILINYNSSAYTQNCIDSILNHTAKSLRLQLVVIDNASGAQDYLKLKDFCDRHPFDGLQLVRNNINVGFGAGNMLGVHYSDAEFLAFINNDSIFKNDCLSIIIDTMRQHPEMGICGPLAYKEDGRLLPTIDHFASPARELLGRRFLEKINPEKYPNRKISYKEPKRAQFVSGSFMLVRSEDFNAVGGFDTNIFLYYEETDLCRRLLKLDKPAYLVPEAVFIHYHGVSTAKSLAIKKELKISLLYVIRKHYGWAAHRLLLTHLTVRYFLSSLFKPKYWPLFLLLLKGAPLSESLKTKQKLHEDPVSLP